MRAQIFVQDASISLVIALITVFSIIAFVNYQNAEFQHGVRNEHKMAVLERIAGKLFLEKGYGFNTDSFVVSRGFITYVNSLNDEEAYERFRQDMGLSREGVSYDVKITLLCDDGSAVTGGKSGTEALHNSLLASMDGQMCRIDMEASEI